jgi:tagatose-1,6-bisphosphate aldolase
MVLETISPKPRNRPETKLVYEQCVLVKQRGQMMLSEKFLLVLEAIMKSDDKSANRDYADGAPRVVSKSPHVPVKLSTSPSEARI